MKRKASRFFSGVLIALALALSVAEVSLIVVLIFDDSPPAEYNIISQDNHGLQRTVYDLCVVTKLSVSLEKKCFGYKVIIVSLSDTQNRMLAFSKLRSHKIYIEQHLLEILTTAEIKALLAHEIGHKLLWTDNEFVVDKFAAKLTSAPVVIEVLKKAAKLMDNEEANREVATRIKVLKSSNAAP